MENKTSLSHSSEVWLLDQFAKSAFFHRKLHEWQMIEVAEVIDTVLGEQYDWSESKREELNISDQAWNKVIHRAIKPVLIFAHPELLQVVPRATGYYRMLSMVSIKSMKRVGKYAERFEITDSLPDSSVSFAMSKHFNHILSTLIESDEELNPREFDLWRGMAAGTQAQGSWQNNKGSAAEVAVQELLLNRARTKSLLPENIRDTSKIELSDGRIIQFASDPDIVIRLDKEIQVAIEVKGGIDAAGILERVGAALKSLRRVKQKQPTALSILILQDVSLTTRAESDLAISLDIVTHVFSLQTLLVQEEQREHFFQLLNL
jgi:hypothetical protein